MTARGAAQRFMRWARASMEGMLRQRVTKGGVGFSVTISIVASLAFLTGNNLLFLLLACMLATLLLSNFLSRLSLAGLELDLVFPEHLSARRDVPARMKLKNEKSWMPSYSIHVSGTRGSVYSSAIYFPMIPAGTTVEETVDVHFARRGEYKENSFELRSQFPFGFTERRVRVTPRREAIVYPCLDPHPASELLLRGLEGEMLAQARGRGDDFYRIRPYGHGESARHVDWKATAHTGELQVREFAQQQEPMVEIYLDAHVGDQHLEWFEHAVDCCAFLSWELTQRGARIRFRSQNFDRQVPAEAGVYTILKFLALVEPVRIRNVVSPGSDSNLQVVVSAAPERLRGAGWSDAHVVGPRAFDNLGNAVAGADAAAVPGDARAGKDNGHRR
ncbi:MAG: DUF58 domain-containing protein [Bryobacteraceae bacterium]